MLKRFIQNRMFLFMLSILLLGIVWELLSIWIGSSLIIPSPVQVIQTLFALFQSPQIWNALLSTFGKGLLGMVISLGLGIPIGFVIGLFPLLDPFFQPFLMILRAMPIVSWLTSVLVLWGMGWQSPLFIVVVTLLPLIIYNVASGVRSVNRGLLEMAHVFRVSLWNRLTQIYLGSMFPFLFSSIQVSLGTMWKATIAAEFLIGDSGIGLRIAWHKTYLETDRVLAYTLLAVACGIAFEYLLIGISSLPWFRRWKLNKNTYGDTKK